MIKAAITILAVIVAIIVAAGTLAIIYWPLDDKKNENRFSDYDNFS